MYQYWYILFIQLSVTHNKLHVNIFWW